LHKGKIMNKKSQISTRREELKLIAPRASGKDLLTTEREVNAKMEEKDSLLNQISAMNKEISILNDSINQANISATRAENIVREKEQLYAQEQENSEKRKKLNESVAASQEKETKVIFVIVLL
jgi:septal ring factor EnvC (AmiA/AmiB activator)